MINNAKKLIFCLSFIACFFFNAAHAQHFQADAFDDPVNFYFQIGDVDDDGDPEYLNSGTPEVRGAIALSDRDPRLMIVGVINVILGFLGIIALVIILAGGFKYMVSGGNQDMSDGAKKLFWSGIVG